MSIFSLRKLTIILLLSLATGLFAQNQILNVGKQGEMMNETILLFHNDSETTIQFDLNRLELVEVATDYGLAFIPTSDKAPLMLQKGSPELIFMTASFIVPDRGNSQLDVSYGMYTDFENIEIAPSKGNILRSVDPATVPYEKGEVYEKDGFFPGTLANLREPFIMRDVRGQSVDIFPVQYNPVTKVLRVYSEITVSVNYTRSGGINEFTNQKRHKTVEPEFNQIYSYMFINHSEVRGQRAFPTGEEGELLIICHPQFMTAMQPYIDWKRTIGRKVTMVSTATSGTTAAAIKSYILSYYNNPANDLAYVLFVGNNSHIPLHTISVSGETIRSDVFYGQLVGTDPYLEVLIGRFIANNVADVETQVQRTIHYERDLTTTDTWLSVGWGGAARECGGHFNECDDQHIENIRTRMLTYGYTTVHQGYTLVPGLPNATVASVSQNFNDGVGVAQYCNHGSKTAWTYYSSSLTYNNTHVNQLTNYGKLPFIYSVACVNGEFQTAGACFAETWMVAKQNNQPTGAIAFFGSTRNLWWTPPMAAQDIFANITMELPPPYTYGNQGNAGIKRTIAGAMLNSSQHMMLVLGTTEQPGQDYQGWLVFGDPTLQFRTKTPQAMTVDHPAVLLIGNDALTVDCDANGAVATLSYIDDNSEVIILGSATVTGGSATIVMAEPPAVPMDIKIAITGFNKVTYTNTIEVIPPSGPYVVVNGYETVSEPLLTYTSQNSETAIRLKNVGIEASSALSVEFTCDNPKITLHNTTAQCGVINPDQISTVPLNVSFANDISDEQIFAVNVTITQDSDGEVWTGKANLKAFAPNLSLQKVLVNGSEAGSLPQGDIVVISAVIENKGGADAYNAVAALGINSPYIRHACGDEDKRESLSIPAGETVNFEFVVVTDVNMPFGHTANFDLSVVADYGISKEFPFTASNTGTNNYCVPGSTGCGSGDRFTSVVLWKTSEPANLLINNQNGTCNTGGYSDFTGTTVELEPGQQYSIKVKCVNYQQQVRGWFDLNGNNVFDDNEMLVNINLPANQELTQNFTIPENLCIPGTYIFRLRCQYNTTAPTPCNGYTYGQTHDYTIVLPEIYPRVQNVAAQLSGSNIIITWDAPEDDTVTPVGYNIYRGSTLLNSELLTETTYTDANLEQGIYFYYVTAAYAGNKESYSQMSNVICFDIPCELPVNVEVTANDNTAVITWEEPEYPADQILLGYNVFRDDELLNEELLTETYYNDEGLIGGTYQYSVSAVYEHCESASGAGSVTIPPQLCNAPLIVNISVNENLTTIYWSKPELIDGIILGYNVYMNGNYFMPASATQQIMNISNLPGGVIYFQISARYAHCAESDLSQPYIIVIEPANCKIPSNLSVTVEEFSSVALIKWDEPLNYVPSLVDPILMYFVYRNGEKIGETDQSVREYLDEDLVYGDYSYQVSAYYFHCGESGLTASVTVNFSDCYPPQGVSATIIDESERDVLITWNLPKANNSLANSLLGYNIYRNEEKIANYDTLPFSATEFIDENLDNGTYIYQISAQYVVCESEIVNSSVVIIDVGITDRYSTTFAIYPNPAAGNVTITGYGLSVVEIYDIQGRKLAEYHNIKETLQINDLNKFESGIYLIKMYSDTKQSITQRLTIVK